MSFNGITIGSVRNFLFSSIINRNCFGNFSSSSLFLIWHGAFFIYISDFIFVISIMFIFYVLIRFGIVAIFPPIRSYPPINHRLIDSFSIRSNNGSSFLDRNTSGNSFLISFFFVGSFIDRFICLLFVTINYNFFSNFFGFIFLDLPLDSYLMAKGM